MYGGPGGYRPSHYQPQQQQSSYQNSRPGIGYQPTGQPPPRQHGNYPAVDFSRPPPGYNGPPGPPSNQSYSPIPNRPSGSGSNSNPSTTPGSSTPAGKTDQLSPQTTLFVGGIASGILDHVLEQLLNACGPLRNLKRVKGATGKPQAFGFAEFEDPDSVLRALAVLNGVELPDLETHGAGKKLIVKADEKTRKFLDDYESMMIRTDADEELELAAVKSITAILESLNNGTELPSTSSTALNSSANPESSSEKESAPDPYAVPAHLRDLQEEEIPEERREVVLDQISAFRQTSASREIEKKRVEEDRERRRIEQMVAAQHQQRVKEQREKEHREREAARLGKSVDEMIGPDRGAFGNGPQGYSKPVGFVAGQDNGHPERTDEEEEEARRERKRRDQMDSLKERERRLDQRERQRFQLLEREAQVEQSRKESDQKDFFIARDRLKAYDDDRLEEAGRDLWFIDRPRWRSQRAPVRRREEEADELDRKAEAEELVILARQEAELRERQRQEQADLAIKQKAAGILTEESGPIKVSIGSAAAAAKALAHPAVGGPGEGGGVRFGDEDDEDDGKKKRVLVKLDYGESLTPEEKERQRLLDLVKLRTQKVPKTQEGLWNANIYWDGIAETTIQHKIEPIARRKMIEFLGELDDDDLLNFVLDHIRGRKSASDLVEGLEPVLEEEAVPYTLAIWSELVFESMASEMGVDTKEVTMA
ncbi:U1 snRNP complex, subunit SNU71 and related PWI-motif proteins [Phaffia rhodozyma]|uniref:U1 snRNP complex, subunit SNU71 and related PWI-motif proteins n=1 Tax=Phaffia rhodozyma TaxID=264483 RepID=A0A0F7SRE7_PHARH|nr:U1 snRNP complex, subunit SNU71 and related PWI-motif proteins [Phaffia rhodozyma]